MTSSINNKHDKGKNKSRNKKDKNLFTVDNIICTYNNLQLLLYRIGELTVKLK